MSVIRRIALGAYALATRAFPRSHRGGYADEMIDGFGVLFDRRVRDRGLGSAIVFTVTACMNVVVSGSGERRRVWRRGLHGQRGRLVEGTVGDLKYAARSLARAGGLALVCVVSLGLGLGALFAITMFLGSLTAVPAGVQPDGLVEVVALPQGPLRADIGGWAIETWSHPDFVDLNDAHTGLAVAAWAVADRVVSRADIAPFNATTMFVAPNYFSLVGTVPEHGRLLALHDGADRDPEPVVVMSHRMWTERFAADSDLIGQTLLVNGREHVLVGVAEEGFRGHLNRRGSRQADLWAPLGHHPHFARAEARTDRSSSWLRVVGRLSEGTPLTEADGAVAGVTTELAARFPASNEHRLGTALAYTSTGTNQTLEMAIVSVMFYALAGIVLLVVCLNLAGMMLVRSATRSRELAIRRSLGASRWRLVRYLMTEAGVIALAGGAVGIAGASTALSMLVWWVGGPYPEAWELTPVRVAGCMAVALATTAIFGLIPALRFSRPRLMAAMNDEAGGGGWAVGRSHRRAAALQAGVALPFLALGGLLFMGARTAATADLGFEPEGLFTASIPVSAAGYSAPERTAFLQEARERLGAVAGVTHVAVADGVPLDYEYRRSRLRRPGDEVSRVRAQVTRVDDRYFTTIGTPVVRGRAIGEQDHAGNGRVVMLSESLAARLFPAENPVSREVVAQIDGIDDVVLTVVGVTSDVATSQVQTERLQMFLPLAQHPTDSAYLIVRAPGSADSMAEAYARIVADLDPALVRPELVTGQGLVDESVGDLLTQSIMAGSVALIALVLSALGIYGVVAFTVAARTRELGVRIALGATRGNVLRLVLLDTFKLVAPGLLLGLLPTVIVVRRSGLVWQSLGIAEPVAYTLATAAALGVAILASLSPAARAASIEPVVAISDD